MYSAHNSTAYAAQLTQQYRAVAAAGRGAGTAAAPQDAIITCTYAYTAQPICMHMQHSIAHAHAAQHHMYASREVHRYQRHICMYSCKLRTQQGAQRAALTDQHVPHDSSTARICAAAQRQQYSSAAALRNCKQQSSTTASQHPMHSSMQQHSSTAARCSAGQNSRGTAAQQSCRIRTAGQHPSSCVCMRSASS